MVRKTIAQFEAMFPTKMAARRIYRFAAGRWEFIAHVAAMLGFRSQVDAAQMAVLQLRA